MNTTEIKTRYGLILQGVLAETLRRGGWSFRENWQYDARNETPDFLLPDSDHPQYVIEVHQTDARNSFQMKILRSFTAVIEAKEHFGDDLVTVNVLFGDPNSEVPESNVRALFGFFDVNVVPRYVATNPIAIQQLEQRALGLAAIKDLSVADAIRQLIGTEPDGITELSNLLHVGLAGVSAKPEFYTLWQAERQRTRALDAAPSAGHPTYYKRAILQSLYLSDAHFAELRANRDPNRCSQELQDQLVSTALVEVRPSVGGRQVLALDPNFRQFLDDPQAVRLRALCVQRLDREPAMHWFFEDIRDTERRNSMARGLIEALSRGSLLEDLVTNLKRDQLHGIEHRRAWLVDLCTRALGVSQNTLSRRLFTSHRNPGNFGDPVSHLAPKTARLRGLSEQNLEIYAEEITTAFFSMANERRVRLDNLQVQDLGRSLLRLRLEGAIRLQMLNPLYLVLESVAAQLGLVATEQGTHSFLSDLSGTADQVGRVGLYHITDGNKILLANAVAVHDHHGDDKSKEWGARRRSTLYRMQRRTITESPYQDSLFVLDGEWGQRDVERLHRSGWNRIVRLGDLEEELRSAFGT